MVFAHLVALRNSLGIVRSGKARAASPVTATTDFLAPDSLDNHGRAVPPEGRALDSTFAHDAALAEGRHLDGHRQRSGPRAQSREASPSPALAQPANRSQRAPWTARARLATLTPRERQVFELVIRGKLNKQIGHRLGATERTIKAHRRMVMEKMQVQSLAELVSLAERIGVLNDHNRGQPTT